MSIYIKDKSSILFIPIYILVFLLPLLPLLSEIFYIPIGTTYNLSGFSKEIIILSFVVFSTIHLIFIKTSINVNWIIISLLLFIFYGFAHIWISHATFHNALNNFRLFFLNIIVSMLLITLYINLRILPNIRLMFGLIFISAFLVSIFGLYEKFINPEIVDLYTKTHDAVLKNIGIPGFERVRITSTLGNPINLGLFMVVGIISALYIMESTNKKLIYLFCFLCLPLFLIVIMFTLSRTAYGSLLLVISSYLLFKVSIEKKIKEKLFFLMSIVLIISILSFIVSDERNNLILLRLFQTIDMYTFSTDPRLEKWGTVIRNLNAEPIYFLWGFGLGNAGTSGLTGNYIIIENSFISIIYELGFIGLMLFCLILFYYLLNTFKLLKIKNKEDKLLGWAFIAYFITFIFASLFIDAYINNPFSSYFWLFFALLIIKRLSKSYQMN